MQLQLPATPTIVLIGALWASVPALGMSGHWFAGLFASLLLMVALAALGSAHRGRLRLGFLLFPIVAWALVWALSFALAERTRAPLEAAVSGAAPEAILGFHPSFAWILLGYWLAGVAVLTGGFLLRRDEWLPEERWRAFRAAVARGEAESAEAGDDAGR